MARTTQKTKRRTNAVQRSAPQAAEMAQRPATQTEHPYTSILGKVFLLWNELAAYAQRSGADKFLGAAHVVEALHGCLAEPEIIPACTKKPLDMAAKLKAVASDLRGLTKKARTQRNGEPTHGSRLPSRLEEYRTAAFALAKSVQLAQQNPQATAGDIATMLELSRTMNADRGAKVVLPNDGTSTERINLFTEAIEKLRNRTNGDEALDPEDVVTACARECDNKRELFGSIRKAQKYVPRKKNEKRQ